jgi:hypothetical protein
MKHPTSWRLNVRIFIFFLSVTVLASWASPPARAGDIQAGGGASDDFELDPALTINDPSFHLGGVIERDRMYMAARPGFLNKHLPLTFDEAGLPYSGGLYLFDTQEDAEDFAQWLSQDFALDGVLILQRPYFLGVKAYTYKVIGAFEFGDYKRDSVVVRTERWSTPRGPWVEPFLKTLWPFVKLEAKIRKYVSVWLLYNEDEQIVNIVSLDDRAGPWDPAQGPDFASLNALANAPTMGKAFDLLHWSKLFDRTSWVLTMWFPFEAGDRGEAALWPNSPPFPEGFFPGDGTCVPSQGENYSNDPEDCLPTCGDGIPQEGENTMNCPGDVPLE